MWCHTRRVGAERAGLPAECAHASPFEGLRTHAAPTVLRYSSTDLSSQRPVCAYAGALMKSRWRLVLAESMA
eukprot:7250920-Prymnesium_polylepis.1